MFDRFLDKCDFFDRQTVQVVDQPIDLPVRRVDLPLEDILLSLGL